MNKNWRKSIGRTAVVLAAIFVGSPLQGAVAITSGASSKVKHAYSLLDNPVMTNNLAATELIANLLAEPQPALTVPVVSQRNSGPVGGTFWTLTEPAPLPFDPYPDLPLYQVGANEFVIDDRSVDYAALNSSSVTVSANSVQALTASSPPLPGDGSGSTNYGTDLTSYTYTLPPGLKITPPVLTNGNASVSIYDQDPSVPYDIYYCTNLASAIPWTLVSHGIVGQTNFIFGNNFAGSQTVFFIVGSGADTMGQGLSDGFIALVLGLNPFAVSADGMTIGWKYLHGLNPAITYTNYVPPATALTITKPANQATIP